MHTEGAVTVRTPYGESALEVSDSGRKIPCRAGDSNPGASVLRLAFQSDALAADELFPPPVREVRDIYSDDIIGYAETDACGYYVIDDNQTASLIGQAMTLFNRMTKSLNSAQFKQAGRQAGRQAADRTRGPSPKSLCSNAATDASGSISYQFAEHVSLTLGNGPRVLLTSAGFACLHSLQRS